MTSLKKAPYTHEEIRDTTKFKEIPEFPNYYLHMQTGDTNVYRCSPRDFKSGIVVMLTPHRNNNDTTYYSLVDKTGKYKNRTYLSLFNNTFLEGAYKAFLINEKQEDQKTND